MRLSLKQILWLWVAIIMMVGLLFGMAYQRFNSDTLVTGLKKELNKAYPGANIEIGNIDTSFLIDINLAIDSITVSKSGIKELTLNHLELKIPWWSLLLESGRVQLNIEGLVLNIPKKEKNLAPLKDKKTTEQMSEESHTLELKLPKYVLNSSLNIRIKDLELIDPKQGSRRLKLSKVIIRDYKVGSKTAFELNIPLSIKWEGNYTGEVWIFGDFISNGEKLDINWRADARGFNQKDWNLNDLFIEGTGHWNPAQKIIEAKVSLIQSSKNISTLDIKVTDNKLSLTGPINQIPLEMIKPLIKYFHPKKELSFFKGSELGTGHFSWNYAWPGSIYHFDLKLGFEGTFFDDQGIWNLEWMSESYKLGFVGIDKKTRFDGLWTPKEVSHKLWFDSKMMNSENLEVYDPFLKYIFPVAKQTTELSFHEVVSEDKLYTGLVSLKRSPLTGQKTLSMKISQEKNSIDAVWSLGEDKAEKVSLQAVKFPLGSFGTYFHPSLVNSLAVLDGVLNIAWVKDIYEGKGNINLSIASFSTGKSSWMKFWEFFAGNFGLIEKPQDLSINANWSKGSLTLKKLSVEGQNLKGMMTGKLDFNGKNSDIYWTDTLSPQKKKIPKTFIIDQFMRSL